LPITRDDTLAVIRVPTASGNAPFVRRVTHGTLHLRSHHVVSAVRTASAPLRTFLEKIPGWYTRQRWSPVTTPTTSRYHYETLVTNWYIAICLNDNLSRTTNLA